MGTIEHKSMEWFRARSGKFTPSELHKLMTEPKSKADILSVGAITYIKEKIAETLIENLPNENEFTNAATAWGNSYEDEAINLFSDQSDTEIIKPGFIDCNDFFGGTPDGIAADGSFGIEVKCPYNPTIHLDNLILDPMDFPKARKEYYYQIQGYALLTGIKDWYFISYDPRQQDPLKIRHILVEMDKDTQKRIREKLKIANEYKQKLINNLKQLK
jgi:hypothetical protein